MYVMLLCVNQIRDDMDDVRWYVGILERIMMSWVTARVGKSRSGCRPAFSSHTTNVYLTGLTELSTAGEFDFHPTMHNCPTGLFKHLRTTYVFIIISKTTPDETISFVRFHTTIGWEVPTVTYWFNTFNTTILNN